jgi:glycosyltransferase involved in cell wall biosynthesis
MASHAEDLQLGVLTTSYPTHLGSSAGPFVRGFCAACGAAGLPVEVLCPEPAREVVLPVDPGVAVQPLAYFRPRWAQFLSASPGAPEALARRPALWAPAAAFAARLTAEVMGRQGGYRGLVSHWLVPCAVSGALASSRPHLAIVHGSDVHLLERLSMGRALARWLVRENLHFAFVSRDLQRRFIALLTPDLKERVIRDSVVQPMGVDGSALVGGDRQGCRERLGLRGPVALWLGRFTPLKRPDLALALAEAMGSLTVVLAGAGPLESALRLRAQSLGKRVRLCGWVDAVGRRDLLAAADVLVITSTALADGRSEGAPMVAREALAAGLPVVATRVGGLEDLAGCPDVELVPDGDVEMLAQACRARLAWGRPDEDIRARRALELDWRTVLGRLLAPLGL